MVFNVYDSTLTRIGEITSVISSVWEEQYRGAGSCQIVVTETDLTSDLFQVGRFVGMPNKSTLWQIKSKEKRDKQIWINGCTVNYEILSDRVYAGKHVSNVIETDLRNAVSTQRPADIVALGPMNNLSATTESEHNYPTLFDLAVDLCETADYGFRFNFDKTQKKLLFEVYEGDVITDVKFAEKYGNTKNIVVLLSDVDYKNVAYVGGPQSDETDQTIVVCGETSSVGIGRHEVYINASDITKEKNQTAEKYKNLLEERGLEELNKLNRKQEITFDVNVSDFGVYYKLGDKITCLLPEDNLKLEVRIISFSETIEQNRTTLRISVGTPIITKIK